MAVDVILGTGWGDEGKGRFVHELSRDADVAARYGGGSNAGHTNVYNGDEVVTNQIPSGIMHPDTFNLLTLSSLVDPVAFDEERERLHGFGIDVSPERLGIADGAQLVLPHHIYEDELRENNGNGQGSTKHGIRFSASDNYARDGAHAELILGDTAELEFVAVQGLEEVNRKRKAIGQDVLDVDEKWKCWIEKALKLGPFLMEDVSGYINGVLDSEGIIIAEGAQAVGLDIVHGIYPYTSSSHTTPGGVLNSFGIGHQHLRNVIGVSKLTLSKVGGTTDLFPTFIEDEDIAARVRGKPGTIDYEGGKRTGRPRDIGWPDIPLIRHAAQVTGMTELILTKLDSVPLYGDVVQVAVDYEYEGQIIARTPNSATKIRNCSPIYVELPTWTEDIGGVRRFKDLPKAAQDLVTLIEREVGVPVTKIGVGADQDQVITRSAA